LVDALGNPLSFFLTPGHAHDLEGADALLPQMQANTLLADKAFDADQRAIEPLRAAGKTSVSRCAPSSPYDAPKIILIAAYASAAGSSEVAPKKRNRHIKPLG
jgi:hypothetical protein